MKYHLSDFVHLLKRNVYTQKKIKKLIILGCSLILILVVLVILVGLYFMKPLLGFLAANIPILNEILFSNMRDLVLPYLQEDIIGMFSGLADKTNVNELKNIVNSYFEQLRVSKNIGFDNFLSFTDQIKSIILDGSVTQNELELLRKFIIEKP